MKAIYSLAFIILSYTGLSGQTTIYLQDFRTFLPKNWYFGYTYNPLIGSDPEYQDQFNTSIQVIHRHNLYKH